MGTTLLLFVYSLWAIICFAFSLLTKYIASFVKGFLIALKRSLKYAIIVLGIFFAIFFIILFAEGDGASIVAGIVELVVMVVIALFFFGDLGALILMLLYSMIEGLIDIIVSISQTLIECFEKVYEDSLKNISELIER